MQFLTCLSLKWYRQGKESIGYDKCYSNNINSTYLAKARTNSLQLEEQVGRARRDNDKTCKLCRQEGGPGKCHGVMP